MFESRHDRDLAAMRLEINILHKFARANSRAIDYEIEFLIDFFEAFKMNIGEDLPSSFEKTIREIIEINGCVRQWYPQRETAFEERIDS